VLYPSGAAGSSGTVATVGGGTGDCDGLGLALGSGVGVDVFVGLGNSVVWVAEIGAAI
jgi:hypothetical protein